MKKLFCTFLMVSITAVVFAQKNVVPASQTQMLGIQLPEGSKQDKRLLSVAAAGSFLSMATEFKNIEARPVEVYSLPSSAGFSLEKVRSLLTANGYSVKSDNGDNKLLWFTRNTKSWLVYLSQEAKETNLYIGEGKLSTIIPGSNSQPVIVESTTSTPPKTNSSVVKTPAHIPPLAGRQTGTRQQKPIQKADDLLFVYDLDSNRYNVIKIGEQYWMKENLHTTQFNDTTLIPTGSQVDWPKIKHGAYAIYDNNPVHAKKYGFLYNGYAVATGKLCPKGWHVATDADWRTLEKSLGIPESELERTGERGNIAYKLKVPDGWNASAFSGNNSSGFSIMPAGARLDNGEYSNLGQYGNFWTSTVYDDRYGLLYLWNHHVHYNTNAVGRIYTVAQNGYSCRCVKDTGFDIVSYTQPPGWIKESGDGFVAYTINNNANNEYARILIFKSLPGTGNIDTDFDIEWKELVQSNYAPGGFTNTKVSEYKDGWISKMGVAPFHYQNANHAALLLTMMKTQTKMSFVFITNTTAYETVFEDFGSSLDFSTNPSVPDHQEIPTGNNKKVTVPAMDKPITSAPAAPGNYDSRLIGKWNRTGATHPHYADAASWGTAGYTTSRYEFRPDGAYLYTERSFWMLHDQIVLVKENGRFSVSNDQLTVTPEKSVIESYTKKNGIDELGSLVKSGPRPLETVTYKFTFHFFSGIQEWNLVLQAPNPTKRDGNFSGNNTFTNAWYFDQKYIDKDLVTAGESPTPRESNTQQTVPSQPSGFTYTISNFDDGWNSTIQKEYVLVEKGNARVYLFYAVPYNSDNFSGTGLMDRDYYWDNYVALHFYTTTKQYNDAGEYISSFLPKYVEGWGVDPVSNETVFIAMTLSVSPNSAQLTVASFPDEASFRQAFPKANDRFASDLAGMVRYNKFAIGKDDFIGTWQSGGSQMTQWYDAITGAYTGATVASSSATFHFYSGGSYSSIHNGATGAVGAMNTFQQEYKGTWNGSNWNMVLTDRYQGKTYNFDAHYQAVRGGRLLYLNNNAGENYLLVRTK